MKLLRTGAISVAVAVSLACTQSGRAAVVGPVPDGWHEVKVPITITVPTHLEICLKIPYTNIGPCIKIGRPNERTYTVNVPSIVIEFSYVEIKKLASDFDVLTDNLILTDIAGLALGGPDDLIATGFSPTAPEVVLVGLPTFEGISGTDYPANVQFTSTLADLPTVLPGYDVSGFTGDPDSIVYVSQFEVPAIDFCEASGCCIPEPAGLAIWSLLGLNIVGIAGWRRRRLLRR